MKIHNIPVTVDTVAVRVRDGAPHVLLKVTADISQATGSPGLRSFIAGSVLPRAGLLDPVDLEGLDQQDRAALSDEDAARLDALMRRRNAALKVSCAAPPAWWERCEVVLRTDDDDAALVLRPAKVDGRIVVEAQGEGASVTLTWACLAPLATSGALDTLGCLFGEVTMDVASDAMQLELFEDRETVDAVADAARKFVQHVRDAGATCRIVTPTQTATINRTVPLFGPRDGAA